jgi:hypothetical protein
MPLAPLQAVMVSGLTSCGAVLVANQDFSQVAAGHMSGDARLVTDWCKALLANAQGPKPYYLIWGTGPDGGVAVGLREHNAYIAQLGIAMGRSPAVANCFAVALTRDGSVFAARDTRFDFKRSGQAVHVPRPEIAADDQVVLDYMMLMSTFDTATPPDQIMLLESIARKVGHEPVAIVMDEPAIKQTVAARGKDLCAAYDRMLPQHLRQQFRSHPFFQANPTLRPS